MDDYTMAPPLVTSQLLEELQFPGDFAEVDVLVAGALVRGECQWHISPLVTVDAMLDTEGGTVLHLPSLHVTAVTSVRDTATGQLITGWTWSPSGMLYRPGGWPAGFQAVAVSYTHGFATPPLEVVAVVAGVAKSRAESGKAPAGLKAKTVGGVTYQYLTAADEAGDPLESYRHALWRYRR